MENILVIECVDNAPLSCFCTKANEHGVRQAEERFVKLIQENTEFKFDSDEERDDLISDGFFEQDNWSVSICWV